MSESKMIEDCKEPPICPECGHKLNEIKQTISKPYKWNGEKYVIKSYVGHYIECKRCGADVEHVF